MIVPGYSESITHNKALVNELADRGLAAFTFSQPRSGRRAIDPIERQSDIIAQVLAAMLPERQKMHAAAHSLGSAALLRAAKKHPERFTGLLLMQPPGMSGRQGFLQLARRVGMKTVKNHSGAMNCLLHGSSPRIIRFLGRIAA